MAASLEKLIGERVKAGTEGDAGWRKGIFFLEMGKTQAWSQVTGNGVGCVKD